MARADNILNMQITIVNCMKQQWNINYSEVSDILDKYDLLSYIAICYEEYNSMGIKGILEDLRMYIDAIKEADYADEVLEQLISDLEPENLPKQYFFGTSAAIQTLRFKKVRREIVG